MKKRREVAWGFFYTSYGKCYPAAYETRAQAESFRRLCVVLKENPGPIFRITPPAKPKRNPYALTGIEVVRTIRFPDWKIRVNGTTKKKGKK